MTKNEQVGQTKLYSHPIVSSFFSAGLQSLEVIIETLWVYIKGEISLWQDPKSLLRAHMHKQEGKNSIPLNYLTMGLKTPLQN